MAQLEHRVSQIEDFIHSLREGRMEIPTTTIKSHFHEAGSYGRQGQSTSNTGHQTSPLRLVSSAVNSAGDATRELDNSGDVIDGMAAVQFQDEHDPGFFGKGNISLPLSVRQLD